VKSILLVRSLALLSAVSTLLGAEGSKVSLTKVAEGFVSPTTVVSLTGTEKALLIADQVGTIHLLAPDGQLREKLYGDLRPRMAKINQAFDERGLLGLALHPEFTKNKKLYVFYSAPKQAGVPEDWDHTTHISEFQTDENGLIMSSEKVLLKIDQPYFNHNGGCIFFGPDGYLYIASGDGGNANDVGRGRGPQGNGQDLNTLMGKILRIDVNNGDPYGIPKDNPFVGKTGRPEIYAYGLRNPWRISFDRGGTRQLYAADVGQDLYEEVNIIVKGGNYGWNIREAFHCFDPANPRKSPADCPKVGANGEPLLDPIFEYKSFRSFPKDPEGKGISITGGYIYRGKAIPHLQGKYVFADWSRHWVKGDGVIYVASPSADGKTWTIDTPTITSHEKGIGAYITAFGEDEEGELYIMTNDSNALIGKSGKVYRLTL
jgi:hypothetical protein